MAHVAQKMRQKICFEFGDSNSKQIITFFRLEADLIDMHVHKLQIMVLLSVLKYYANDLNRLQNFSKVYSLK